MAGLEVNFTDIGRLTRDPELNYVSGDIPVVKFTIAVDRPHGEKKTDFYKVVAWRAQAENIAKYLTKGSLCAVQGRVQTDQYEDREGVKRERTEVVARSVQFLDSKKRRDDSEYAEQDSPF